MRTVLTLTLLACLQGCVPVGRYEQHYDAAPQPSIHVPVPGDPAPLDLSASWVVEDGKVLVTLVAGRLEVDALPRIEVGCDAARLHSDGRASSPMAGATKLLGTAPDGRATWRPADFCTTRQEPVSNAYVHNWRDKTGLRYDVVLAFPLPSGLTHTVVAHSTIDAVEEKVKTLLGFYPRSIELSIPIRAVGGEATTYRVRFDRTTSERWAIEWLWPLVSKG